MKKITLLICLLGVTSVFAQNGGDTCATAVAITPGDFTQTLIADGTAGGEMGNTQPRSAAWFTYTPTEDGFIDLSSCLGGSDTRVHVGTGTCGSLTVVATNDDTCPFMADGTGNAWASEIIGISVTNGTTYYIEWDDRWELGPFDWSLTFTPAAPCEEITDVVFDYITDVNVDFSWDDPVFGAVTGYNVEIVPAGNGQGVGVVYSNSVVGNSDSSGDVLTASMDYDVYIQTDCGGDGTSGYAGPFTFTTLSGPPPVNDVCSGAISVTHETNVPNVDAATPTSSSIENAVQSNTPSEDCSGFIGDGTDDVWFSFTALTTDVTITAELNFDGVLVLYSGACDNLMLFGDCVDETTAGPAVEELTASGLTVNDTYYIRVYNYFTAPPDDPTFDLKVWTASTLGLDDVVNSNELTYFPNPVKNTLKVRAQNAIQNISVFNMLGQEVLRTAPNALESEMNMGQLQNGTYFVKVSINDSTQTFQVVKH